MPIVRLSIKHIVRYVRVLDRQADVRFSWGELAYSLSPSLSLALSLSFFDINELRYYL